MSSKGLFGDSSSDEEEAKAPEKKTTTTTTGLFGDDDDSSEGEEFDDKNASITGGKQQKQQQQQQQSGLDDRMDIIDSDDDNEGKENDNADNNIVDDTPLVDQRLLVIPSIQNRPTDTTSLHMTKLPNLVGVQTAPFDPDTYSHAIEEQDFGQSVDNLIRWRYKRDNHNNDVRTNTGQLIRESNTRIVQWEDGSYSLHIGKESFEIDIHNNSTGDFSGLNGYLYLSQKASIENEPAGTVLEAVGPVASRLAIRPSSLQSEAHKSLTVAVRQKTIKKARIAQYVTQDDPEKAKQERIRVKEDMNKLSSRKKTKSSSYSNRTSRPRMSRDYMEDEDDGDYDTFDIKRTKKRLLDADDYEDDEDDYESEEAADTTFNRGRSNVQTRKDSDDEIVVGGDSSDDDEEFGVARAATKKPVQRNVFDDDSD